MLEECRTHKINCNQKYLHNFTQFHLKLCFSFLPFLRYVPSYVLLLLVLRTATTTAATIVLVVPALPLPPSLRLTATTVQVP